MPLAGGTPRISTLVARLDGERYFVATQEQAQQVGSGARRWERTRIPAQKAAQEELTIPLDSFHEGAGFSFAGLPAVYDYADGWDATAPGKVTTWARHAVGADVSETLTGYQGWLVWHADALYMCRGGKVSKYTFSATPGSTWSVATSKTFDANEVVAGRPGIFKGKLYVPILTSTTGVIERFWELTTPSTNSWTEGPAAKEARAFKVWRNLLVRADGNEVETCAADPMTAGNWSGTGAVGDAASPVGDSGNEILDLGTWDRYLAVGKKDGLWTFDENLNTINELPDLRESPDDENTIGMGYSKGALFIPHESGLIQWVPGGYQFVGPEQEGGLEGDVSHGWGKATFVLPYGKYTFIGVKDTENQKGALIALLPAGANRSPVPHMFHEFDGYPEGMCIIRSSDVTYLAVIVADTDGSPARPYIYRLPRASLSPANDPGVPKHVTGTDFEVWASVEDGTAFQLIDSIGGSAAAFTATGYHKAFFPATAASVGAYVRLEFRAGSNVFYTSRYYQPGRDVQKQFLRFEFWADIDVSAGTISVTVRDGSLTVLPQPEMVDGIQAMLVLGAGEFEDRTSMRRTPKEQERNLLALAGPTTALVPYRDPWGNDGYANVRVDSIREVVFKGFEEPTKVALVTLMEVKDA